MLEAQHNDYNIVYNIYDIVHANITKWINQPYYTYRIHMINAHCGCESLAAFVDQVMQIEIKVLLLCLVCFKFTTCWTNIDQDVNTWTTA